MIIRTYAKSHIAHLYAPELPPISARNRLNRWINGDQQLLKALSQVGYFRHQQNHYFTKEEVGILFEYLGEP